MLHPVRTALLGGHLDLPGDLFSCQSDLDLRSAGCSLALLPVLGALRKLEDSEQEL